MRPLFVYLAAVLLLAVLILTRHAPPLRLCDEVAVADRPGCVSGLNNP